MNERRIFILGMNIFFPPTSKPLETMWRSFMSVLGTCWSSMSSMADCRLFLMCSMLGKSLSKSEFRSDFSSTSTLFSSMKENQTFHEFQKLLSTRYSLLCGNKKHSCFEFAIGSTKILNATCNMKIIIYMKNVYFYIYKTYHNYRPVVNLN